MNPLLRGVTIEEAMTRKVVSVGMKAPVTAVLEAITSNNVTGIVVVDEKGDCRGIISTFDILGAFGGMTRAEMKRLKAEDIMTKYAIDMDKRESLDEAARVMREFNVHRLVVISGEHRRWKPIGIISSTDITRFIQRELGR